MTPTPPWTLSFGNGHEGYSLEATPIAVRAAFDMRYPRLDHAGMHMLEPPMDAELASDDPRISMLWAELLELEADPRRRGGERNDDSFHVTIKTAAGERSVQLGADASSVLGGLLRNLSWVVHWTRPSPPWTIVYADGSANVYRVAGTLEGVRFRYEPVTPAMSSTGMYSGGAPVDEDLGPGSELVKQLWRTLQGLQVARRHHTETRNKGDGAVTITTSSDTQSFFIARVATRELEALLETGRRP